MKGRSSQKENNRAVRRGEMDGTGCLAFSWTFSTCLKTGCLNENTNLCGGWCWSDPFVADLVIMFSVLPRLNVSIRTRRMCSMHSIFCSAGLTNVWHLSLRIGGINVYALRENCFSFSFFVQHVAPIGKNWDSCITVLKICHQSMLY